MPIPVENREPAPVAARDAVLEAAIFDAERRRGEAMLANDPEALAPLLDPRLHFAHATGAVDDRDAVLAKLAAGRIRYRAIAWSEQRVTRLGADAALLTGRMDTEVSVEGVDKRLENRVTLVWARDDGAWRAVAFQSTPLKA